MSVILGMLSTYSIFFLRKKPLLLHNTLQAKTHICRVDPAPGQQSATSSSAASVVMLVICSFRLDLKNYWLLMI
jgi:hypothetical protein